MRPSRFVFSLLALLPFTTFAGGIVPPSGGSSGIPAVTADPEVPTDGTKNITGALTASGNINITDGRFSVDGANPYIIVDTAAASGVALRTTTNSANHGFGTYDDQYPAIFMGHATNPIFYPTGTQFRLADTAGAVWGNIGYTASVLNFDLLTSYTADMPLTIGGTDDDGASAVGVIVDTEAYTTSGAKLLSVRNATVEKASVDKDGKFVIAAGLTYSGVMTGSGASTITIGGAMQASGFIANDGTVNSGSTATGAGGMRIWTSTTHKIRINPAATMPVMIETSGSKVACASAYQGALFYQAGGAGVTDTVFVCLKAAADTYAWIPIITGG